MSLVRAHSIDWAGGASSVEDIDDRLREIFAKIEDNFGDICSEAIGIVTGIEEDGVLILDSTSPLARTTDPLSEDTTTFLRRDGTWAVPPSSGSGTYTRVTNSDTGTKNDWAPGISGNTIIEWSGSSDLTVTGLASGTTAQIVEFKNTGTKIAYFAHNSGSSSAGNKLFNMVTSGVTPVAPKGSLSYYYDGTQWQLLHHEQGPAIDVPFTAGDFTGNGAMTWTLDSADLSQFSYHLVGRFVTFQIAIASSTTGGTPNTNLRVLIPNGWTISATQSIIGFARTQNNGGTVAAGFIQATDADNTHILFKLMAAGNWANGTNNNAQQGQISFNID